MKKQQQKEPNHEVFNNWTIQEFNHITNIAEKLSNLKNHEK